MVTKHDRRRLTTTRRGLTDGDAGRLALQVWRPLVKPLLRAARRFPPGPPAGRVKCRM